MTHSCVLLGPNFSCATAPKRDFRTCAGPYLLFPPASGACTEPSKAVIKSTARKTIIKGVPKRLGINTDKGTTCAVPVSYPPKIGNIRPGVSLICGDRSNGNVTN